MAVCVCAAVSAPVLLHNPSPSGRTVTTSIPSHLIGVFFFFLDSGLIQIRMEIGQSKN